MTPDRIVDLLMFCGLAVGATAAAGVACLALWVTVCDIAGRTKPGTPQVPESAEVAAHRHAVGGHHRLARNQYRRVLR